MKATTTTKVALETNAHEARVVVFFQAKLRKRKAANAQLGFSKSPSKLL